MVHVLRDPRDACVSAFQRVYTAGSFQYTSDLRECGCYARLHLRLMRHWAALYPGMAPDNVNRGPARGPLGSEWGLYHLRSHEVNSTRILRTIHPSIHPLMLTFDHFSLQQRR